MESGGGEDWGVQEGPGLKQEGNTNIRQSFHHCEHQTDALVSYFTLEEKKNSQVISFFLV